MPTLVVYPDAGTGNTTVDGVTGRNVAGTWLQVRDGGGSFAFASEVETNCVYMDSNATPQWWRIYRSIFLFDTSILPDTCTINASIFNAYWTTAVDDYAQSISLVSSNPASNNALVAADYSTLGTTKYATDSVLLDRIGWAYNDLVMNAAGRAVISKTSVTKLGFRLTSDLSNTAPAIQTSKKTQLYMRMADYVGTQCDPKLTITYNAKYDINAIFLGSNF